jgi:type IV pilus assembly protein PilW
MMNRRFLASHRARQHGLTLVELLVSMALALLVTLVAIGALLFSRQGSSAMEQSANLRDNARFGTDLVRRIVLQSGFESIQANTAVREGSATWSGGAVDAAPDVEGFNNALVAAGGDPTTVANGSRAGGCGTVSDTSCVNGSDVLVLRYQGMSIGGVPDRSVVNCAGQAVGDATAMADRPMSAFHVRRSAAGEPTLVCSYVDADDGTLKHRELVEGVESFQVLFGVDGVNPGEVLSAAAAASAATFVHRYLRADQMVVVGNPVATRENWRRVRAVRIGMILRGPVGSAVQGNLVQTMYPLGRLLATGGDAFSTFVTPADGRLRQEVTFTVLLRNFQGV